MSEEVERQWSVSGGCNESGVKGEGEKRGVVGEGESGVVNGNFEGLLVVNGVAVQVTFQPLTECKEAGRGWARGERGAAGAHSWTEFSIKPGPPSDQFHRINAGFYCTFLRHLEGGML